jgi:hypothetical protein
MCCRDDEDLALDRIDAERTRGPAHLQPAHARLPVAPAIACASVVELKAELTQLRERIGQYPEHLVDQLHAARRVRAEAQRVADIARARIAQLEQPARGVLRRRAADSAERALERQRLKLAEGEIAAAADRERNLASSVPDRTAWEAERRVLRERAAELNAQLSSRHREHLRLVLERPAPYLTEALGALPGQPRARRTWQQAATRIEAYRFDHVPARDRNARHAETPHGRFRAKCKRPSPDPRHACYGRGPRIRQRGSRLTPASAEGQ